MSPLPRGSVIGMLGTGQLGRMTALAAAPLGYEVHAFGPSRGGLNQVTSRETVAAYDDLEALAAFADAVDVVTYEFENVPAATADFLAARVPVRPGPKALSVAQHRVVEKQFLADHGLPTAPWRAVGSRDELAAAVEALGRPAVLKTARFGYDGKGQTFVREGDDLSACWAAIAGEATEREAILEGFVPFAYEASVVVARGVDGDVAAFDLVENKHTNHILHETHAPAPLASEATRREARACATKIVEALDYVGVCGVEFFVLEDGSLAVNELAPRPHNSGHWTQDAAVTSQFEQHARAVVGLPLGDPSRRCDAVMHNLLGDEIDRLAELAADPKVKLHLYGKAEAKVGRKMGHYTRLA